MPTRGPYRRRALAPGLRPHSAAGQKVPQVQPGIEADDQGTRDGVTSPRRLETSWASVPRRSS